MNPCPKPRPALLSKRDAKAKTATIDRAENAKVKRRSTGLCEVRVVTPNALTGVRYISRCWRRASHVHHLIAGIGRRNVGRSILAEHKLHTCGICHSEIHGHVLQPVNATEREAAATIRYERVK